MATLKRQEVATTMELSWDCTLLRLTKPESNLVIKIFSIQQSSNLKFLIFRRRRQIRIKTQAQEKEEGQGQGKERWSRNASVLRRHIEGKDWILLQGDSNWNPIEIPENRSFITFG